MKRGSQLKVAKLTESDVKIILDCVDERKRLRAEANMLSNKSLAVKFGVHVRTIDRVTDGTAWGHVMQ